MFRTLILFLFIPLTVHSQERDTVLSIVETMPEYPGGANEMNRFISKNIHYPRSAAENNIQGRVVVQFTVDTSGMVCKTRIIKSLPLGPDEEVLRIMSLMPRWKPATQNGKPVNVVYNLPITFSLYGNKKKPVPDLKNLVLVFPEYPAPQEEIQSLIRNEFDYKQLQGKYLQEALKLRLVIDAKGRILEVEAEEIIAGPDLKSIRKFLKKKLKAFNPGLLNGQKATLPYKLSFPLKAG